MSPSVVYDYQYARTGEGLQTRSWLRYIILWRGQPGWAQRSTRNAGADALNQRAYRARYRAAEDAGREVIGGMQGGVAYGAEIDHASRSLQLLGASYQIPMRDSALIVMVDRVDSVGGPPVVTGIAYINARIANPFWGRSWSSGDTIFMVHPHNEGEIVRVLLAQNPAVSAFLR